MSPFRRATHVDEQAVVSLMRRYYDEDAYPFDEGAAKRAVLQLIGDERLGWLWVAEREGVTVGYLAVTLGFSLEYRGRDAFVDEIYLLPEVRGHGLGTKALELAKTTCRAAGVRALHLEVERNKPEALRLYRRAGFQENDRYLMTRWL